MCDVDGVFARAYAMLPTGRVNGAAAPNVFDSERMTIKQIYDAMMKAESSAKPIEAAVVDAVPVCIMLLGSSESRKRKLFQGPYVDSRENAPSQRQAGDCGIIGLVAEDLFALLASERSNMLRRRCVATVKFVEFYGELITDLLRPREYNLDGKSTVVAVADATSPPVYSVNDVARLVSGGRARRESHAEVHSSMEGAAGFFEFQLHYLSLSESAKQNSSKGKSKSVVLSDEEFAQGWRCSAVSTIAVVELPTYKVAAQNRSLLALERYMDELCKGVAPTQFIPGGSSQLISLIGDSIGGNCLLVSLACADRSDSSEAASSMLDLHHKIKNTRQFPVSLTQTYAMGLTLRYRAQQALMLGAVTDCRSEIMKLREVVNGGKGTGGRQLPKQLHELKSLLAASRLDTASARKDSIEVYKVLELFKCKYTQLTEEKTHQTKALIHSEQAKLQVSRALLDSQLEAARARESSELDEFMSESALLAMKDEVAELKGECETLRARKDQMCTREQQLIMELDQCRSTSDMLRSDAARVQKQRDAIGDMKSAEQVRNIELSAEVLKLVAERDALQCSVKKSEEVIRDMRIAKSEHESVSKNLQEKNDELLHGAAGVKRELGEFQRKYACVVAKLTQARVETERALLEQDKAASTIIKDKEAEIVQMKKLVDEGLHSLCLLMDHEATNKKKIQTSASATDRRARELELALKRCKANAVRDQAETSAIGERLDVIQARYRMRLDADLTAILSSCQQNAQDTTPNWSQLSDTHDFIKKFIEVRVPREHGFVASYYREFVQSYQERENQLNSDLNSLMRSERLSVARFRTSFDYCQLLQHALADHAPFLLKETRKRWDNNLKYSVVNFRGTTDIEAVEVDIKAVEAQRDNYVRALQKVRIQAVLQHDQAISVIRGLQVVCKNEQERNNELAHELVRLKQDQAKALLEVDHINKRAVVHIAQCEAEAERSRVSKEAAGSTILNRIEVLQRQVVNSLQEMGEFHKTEAPAQPPSKEQSNRNAKYVDALKHKLCHDLEMAALASDDLDLVAEDLSVHKRLSIARQTNASLIRDLEAVAYNSDSCVALCEAEKRCTKLVYKNAMLEEELQHYRDYMKKTVRRFQRAIHTTVSRFPSPSGARGG